MTTYCKRPRDRAKHALRINPEMFASLEGARIPVWSKAFVCVDIECFPQQLLKSELLSLAVGIVKPVMMTVIAGLPHEPHTRRS